MQQSKNSLFCHELIPIHSDLKKKDAIDHDVFRYGQTTGSLNVRVNVAKFLSEGYGRPVD